jgi:hypothetical protein
MLLLVAHKSKEMVGFNALFLLWLDHLDDPNFPMAYDMKPYTDEEIQFKHETVRRQIAGLTHGFLEITPFGGALFCSKSVQFFHRTARDFVLENPHLQKFHADSSGIPIPDTYVRFDIAELWFSRPGAHACSLRRPRYTEVSDLKLLLAIGKARAYHNSSSSPRTFPGFNITFQRMASRTAGSLHFLDSAPESQLHYIINWFHASEYIKFVASQGRQALEERDGLSCLLSACIPDWAPTTVLKT